MANPSIQIFIVVLLIFSLIFIIWDRYEPVTAHIMAYLLILLVVGGVAANYNRTGAIAIIREMWPLLVGIPCSSAITAIVNSVFVPYSHTEECREREQAERENRERDELFRLNQKYGGRSDAE